MDFKELKEIGLTEGEIKVYTSLLGLGLSTKGIIASTARVSESKVYEILNRLKDKGLVMFVQKRLGRKEVMHYKAANPIMLKELLQKRRDEIDRESRLVDTILPSLQAQMQITATEYSAVIYQGLKGIMTHNSEVLEHVKKGDTWIAMGVRSDKPSEYNAYWVKFFTQYSKKGGRAQVIFVDRGTWYYNQMKAIKNIAVAHFAGVSPAAVAVYHNRVIIYHYGEAPGCLAITNKDVAASFRGFFESLWSLAEKEK